MSASLHVYHTAYVHTREYEKKNLAEANPLGLFEKGLYFVISALLLYRILLVKTCKTLDSNPRAKGYLFNYLLMIYLFLWR